MCVKYSFLFPVHCGQGFLLVSLTAVMPAISQALRSSKHSHFYRKNLFTQFSRNKKQAHPFLIQIWLCFCLFTSITPSCFIFLFSFTKVLFFLENTIVLPSSATAAKATHGTDQEMKNMLWCEGQRYYCMRLLRVISLHLSHKQCIQSLFKGHFGKLHQSMNGDASRCSLISVAELPQPCVDFKHSTTKAVNNEL